VELRRHEIAESLAKVVNGRSRATDTERRNGNLSLVARCAAGAHSRHETGGRREHDDGDANADVRPPPRSCGGERSTRNRGSERLHKFFRARWSLRWTLLETARYDPRNVRRHRRREVRDRLGRR
jgi:hypothetical protein